MIREMIFFTEKFYSDCFITAKRPSHFSAFLFLLSKRNILEISTYFVDNNQK